MTVSSSPPSPPAGTRPPTGLLVASTLCWLWGILVGLSGLALLIPAVAAPGFRIGAAIFAAAIILLAIVYCVAGSLIRKMRLTGGWIGVVSAGILSVFQIQARTRTVAVSLLINLAIVLLLVFNWRHLKASRQKVGA